MSVQTEINRITTNIEAAYAAASIKGASLPAVQNSDNLSTCINSIAFIKVYTGSGIPDNALGENGDVYIQVG